MIQGFYVAVVICNILFPVFSQSYFPAYFISGFFYWLGRLCSALCFILSVKVLFFVYDVLQWIGFLGGSSEKVCLFLFLFLCSILSGGCFAHFYVIPGLTVCHSRFDRESTLPGNRPLRAPLLQEQSVDRR